MDVIAQAVEMYKPVKIFALYSSGTHSLVSTHYAMEHGAHEVVHISTGIGVNEPGGLSVLEVVHETCRDHGWPYRIETPPNLGYRGMVLKYGFPGPGTHLYPYSWLKDRCIWKVQRETKKHRMDRVGFVTGVHKTESARRMGYVKPIFKEKARIWIAPLFNWNELDFAEYRKIHDLKRSPIAEKFGMSGECFCGAFAEPGELVKIGEMFPALHRQITSLAEEAKAAGVHCEWGTRPPKRQDSNQFDIPFMPLCVNCLS